MRVWGGYPSNILVVRERGWVERKVSYDPLSIINFGGWKKPGAGAEQVSPPGGVCGRGHLQILASLILTPIKTLGGGSTPANPIWVVNLDSDPTPVYVHPSARGLFGWHIMIRIGVLGLSCCFLGS